MHHGYKYPGLRELWTVVILTKMRPACAGEGAADPREGRLQQYQGPTTNARS
jgi:hypothetical protein